MRNTKAQFFIVSSVLIIFVITAIFIFITNAKSMDTDAAASADQERFMRYIENEYGMQVELTLSEASLGGMDTTTAQTALAANLTAFNNFIISMARLRGLDPVNMSATIYEATNTSMNATVTVTLQGLEWNSSNTFDAHRAISLGLGSFAFGDGKCNFTVSPTKEYVEPIQELAIANVNTVNLNGTAVNPAVSCSMNTIGTGTYNMSCSSAIDCTVSPFAITVNVTDTRNILVIGSSSV